MAYQVPWDEGTPLGSAQADTLDTIIQNLKISLAERLDDVINDWRDDSVEPKTLKTDFSSVGVGYDEEFSKTIYDGTDTETPVRESSSTVHDVIFCEFRDVPIDANGRTGYIQASEFDDFYDGNVVFLEAVVSANTDRIGVLAVEVLNDKFKVQFFDDETDDVANGIVNHPNGITFFAIIPIQVV